jgi:hypothetical protein
VKLIIVLYESFSPPTGVQVDYEDAALPTEDELLGKLNPFPKQPYRGYKLVCERKFIVLKGENEIHIVIGPSMLPESYYHTDLFTIYRRQTFCRLNCHGGGFVTTTCWWGDYGDGILHLRSERILFHGKSSHYGAYDNSILDPAIRDGIQKALDREITFQVEK